MHTKYYAPEEHDVRAIREFFVALASNKPDDYKIELRRFPDPGQTGHESPIERIFCDTAEAAIEQAIEFLTGDIGVHASLNHRCKESGSRDGVDMIFNFSADLDFKNGFTRERRDQQLRVLEEFGLKPSILFTTGHGYRPIWVLDRGHEPKYFQDIEDKLRYFFGDYDLNNIDKWSDLNRMTRIPGSFNRKDDKQVKTEIMYATDRQFRWQDFCGEKVSSLLISPPKPQHDEKGHTSATEYDGPEFDLEAWIDERDGLEVDGLELKVDHTKKAADAETWVLNGCPMREHRNKDLGAYIFKYDDGGIAAGCHHASCKDE